MSDDSLVHMDDLKTWAGLSPNVKPIRESIGAGAIVRMKSGGPNMVVIERSTNWAYLTWQKDDGNDVLKDWVPITCLEVVK